MAVDLAQELGKMYDYDVLYGIYSDHMHSRPLDAYILEVDGKLTIGRPRAVRGPGFTMRPAFGGAIGAYEKLIEHYRAQELEGLSIKVGGWMQRYEDEDGRS